MIFKSYPHILGHWGSKQRVIQGGLELQKKKKNSHFLKNSKPRVGGLERLGWFPNCYRFLIMKASLRTQLENSITIWFLQILVPTHLDFANTEGHIYWEGLRTLPVQILWISVLSSCSNILLWLSLSAHIGDVVLNRSIIHKLVTHLKAWVHTKSICIHKLLEQTQNKTFIWLQIKLYIIGIKWKFKINFSNVYMWDLTFKMSTLLLSCYSQKHATLTVHNRQDCQRSGAAGRTVSLYHT